MRIIADRFTLIKKYIEGKEVLDLGSSAQDTIEKKLLKNKPNLYLRMKEAAKEVTGVDLYSDSKEIVKGDASTVSLGRKFDVVVMASVLNHIENHDALIENCKKHMKSEGKLIITTQNLRSWRAMLKQERDVPRGTGHVSLQTYETLQNLLNRHELKIVDGAYYYGDKAWYPFPMRLFGRFQQTMVVIAEKDEDIEAVVLQA